MNEDIFSLDYEYLAEHMDVIACQNSKIVEEFNFDIYFDAALFCVFLFSFFFVLIFIVQSHGMNAEDYRLSIW